MEITLQEFGLTIEAIWDIAIMTSMNQVSQILVAYSTHRQVKGRKVIGGVREIYHQELFICKVVLHQIHFPNYYFHHPLMTETISGLDYATNYG